MSAIRFALVLSEIEESRSVHELPLRPLDIVSTEQIVADALHTPTVPRVSRSLSSA